MDKRLSDFIQLVDDSISEKLKAWVRDFELTYKRKPVYEEFNNFEIEKTAQNIFLDERLNVKGILNKLQEKYNNEDELTKLICSALVSNTNDQIPVEGRIILYRLTYFLKQNQEIGNALKTAIEEYKGIDVGDELRRLLMKHISWENYVSLGIGYINSEDSELRAIGNQIIYTSGRLNEKQKMKLLEAYNRALSFEKNKEAKSKDETFDERFYQISIDNLLKNGEVKT